MRIKRESVTLTLPHWSIMHGIDLPSRRYRSTRWYMNCMSYVISVQWIAVAIKSGQCKLYTSVTQKQMPLKLSRPLDRDWCDKERGSPKQSSGTEESGQWRSVDDMWRARRREIIDGLWSSLTVFVPALIDSEQLMVICHVTDVFNLAVVWCGVNNAMQCADKVLNTEEIDRSWLTSYPHVLR